MNSPVFIQKLLNRLKSGDSRSIHLNALPGNFARLDVYELSKIDQSLHLKLLEKLLTQPTFELRITIPPDVIAQKNAEEQKQLRKTIQRLNHLNYQEKEELAEHGYTSFGFGYPLLIKRDPQQPEKILKAPIFIWYLNIEKDSTRNNTWIIRREEDHPLLFNELLQNHLAATEQMNTGDLEALLEDDFITEPQLNHFCRQLLERLHVPFNAEENIATILPCTNKETLEQLTKSGPWIRWSGVLGLYKMQKHSIIKDLENYLESLTLENTLTENTEPAEDLEILSPVMLDPSQENVLYQTRQHDKIVIQGPPGTGKSQSLTAAIIQALLHGQKVLVVCEKKTAMEVLYNNLRKHELESLAVLVEDVYTDRKAVVEKVRAVLDNAENLVPVRFRQHEFEQIRAQFLSARESVNYRLNFSNQLIFGDDNWTELLQRSLVMNSDISIAEKSAQLQKWLRSSDYQFSYEEYLSLKEIVQQAEKYYQTVDAAALVYEKIPDTFFAADHQAASLQQQIKELSGLSRQLIRLIEDNSRIYGKDFLQLKGFTAFKVSVLSIFSKKYKDIIAQQENTRQILSQLNRQLHDSNFPLTAPDETAISEQIDTILPALQQMAVSLQDYISPIRFLPDYFSYRKYIQTLSAAAKSLIQALQKTGQTPWLPVFETYYLQQTILKTGWEHGMQEDMRQIYPALTEHDRTIKPQIGHKIRKEWQERLQQLLPQRDIASLRYVYNLRKNKQYATKNSLRKIVQHDFDFFTTVFPVVMMNPSAATSILPLQEDLFDYIILDEASQLRLEDTYTSLLRGKRKIVSGDKHQMPPSNFFGTELIFWQEDNEAEEVDSFLAESKSLLEYSEDAGFKNTYLDFHYRSLHPDLIQFSNHAFYQSRLVPMPVKSVYQAIHYHPVNGTYDEGTNPAEAAAIVDWIYSVQPLPEQETLPGVGIATFNIYQRNLILDMLYEKAYEDNRKNEHLQALLHQGLFVKNLENIQGDERDIMLLSTTFGPDKTGKFRQLFGPLSQEKGYQLLNVIITRAKHSLHVFTSIPETTFLHFEEELQTKGNTGKAILYAYLSYVKACAENNTIQQEAIRRLLEKNQSAATSAVNRKTGLSDFKTYLFQLLSAEFGEQIVQDYPFGGMQLDLVLLKDGAPVLHLQLEQASDYHPDVAYRNKLHQENILRQYTLPSYSIWSFNWWSNPQLELARLKETCDSLI